MAKQDSIQALIRRNKALEKANAQLIRQIEELQKTKPSKSPQEDLKKIDSQSNEKGKKAPKLTKAFLDQRITERTIDLKLDKENLSRLNTLFEETNAYAKVGGWEIDLERQSAIFTPQTFEIYELPHDQTPSIEEGISYYHPDDRQTIMDVVAHAIENQVPYDVEVRMITAKNNQIWVHTKGSPVVEDGKVVRLHGSIQDITEQRKSQIALKKAQEIAKLGSWHLDLSTGEITWSEELFKMYGFDPNKPIPPYEEHSKFMESESWKLLNFSIERTSKTGEPYSVELKTVKNEGDWQWIYGQGEAIFNGKNEIIGITGIAQDITARKLAELARQKLMTKVVESEKKLSKAFNELQEKHHELEKEKQFKDSITEGSTSGIYIHDISTKRHIFTNKRYEEILGWSKEEINKMSQKELYGLFHPDDVKIALNAISKLIQEKKEQEYLYRFKSKSNKWIWCRSIDVPYELDTQGEVKSFIGSFQDVTELIESKKEMVQLSLAKEELQKSKNEIQDHKKLLEQRVKERTNQLLKSELRLKGAQEIANLGNFEHDFVNDTLWWSDTLFKVLGFEKNVHPPKYDEFITRVDKEDAKRLNELVERAQKYGENYSMTYKYKIPNQEVKYILVHTEVIFDNDQNPSGLLGTAQDITSRRISEINLAKEVERYQFLTNFLPDIFWASDADGALTFVNESGLKVLGVTEEKLLADGWFEVIHPDDTPTVAEKWTVSTKEKKPYINEQRMKTHDGSYQWFKVSASPHFNENGEIDEWIGLSINIDNEVKNLKAIKKASKELKATNQKLSSLVDNIPGAAFNCKMDDAYSMNFISPYIKEISGYDSDEIFPKGDIKFSEIIHEDDRKMVNEELQNAIKGNKKNNIYYRIICKNGDIKWVMENGEFNGKGKNRTIDGVLIDATDRIKAEEKLIEAIFHTEDVTRKQMSKELYDGLHESLKVARMNFRSFAREAKKMGPTASKRLSAGLEYLDECINESGNLTFGLVPKSIRENGIIKSIEQLIDSYRGKMKIVFHQNIDHFHFEERIEIGIYRILQELVNNIHKFSNAQKTTIQLYEKEKVLSLSIEAEETETSLSVNDEQEMNLMLLATKSRALALGGDCTLNKSPNSSLYLIDVPLHPTEKEMV